MMKLDRSFYERDTLIVAKELLGKYIVHSTPQGRYVMKITETEAYKGTRDKACHAYNGRLTPRTKVMFGKGGFAYIYLIYGMYCCFNVVTEKEGSGSAVLIRGGVPVENKNIMSMARYGMPYDKLSKNNIKNFANGPGKLCKALDIHKSLNGEDLTGNKLYIEEGEKVSRFNTGKRINIDYAEEARDFLWRFYI